MVPFISPGLLSRFVGPDMGPCSCALVHGPCSWALAVAAPVAGWARPACSDRFSRLAGRYLPTSFSRLATVLPLARVPGARAEQTFAPVARLPGTGGQMFRQGGPRSGIFRRASARLGPCARQGNGKETARKREGIAAMKIATVATGGIGGYLAVRLIEAGHQVATIARGAHLAAIRDKGLRLAAHDGEHCAVPWIATDDPREVGEVDAVVFAVKCAGLEAAAELCRPLLGAQTLLVPFLNGVEASDRLPASCPRTMSATVSPSSRPPSPSPASSPRPGNSASSSLPSATAARRRASMRCATPSSRPACRRRRPTT